MKTGYIDKEVVVAGLGLVTPLGRSPWSTFRALLDGKTLADRARRLPVDVAPVDMVRAVGCVASVQHTAIDPATALAEQAARQAISMPGQQAVSAETIDATYLGTSKGAIQSFGKDPARHRTAAQTVALGPCGYLAEQLRRRLDVGACQCIVAACASGLQALDHARRRLLFDPTCRRVLVVSTDAALFPLLIGSYRRLGLTAPMTPDAYIARPLDQRRGGVILAESGAAVMLERRDRLQPGDIALVNTACANEAYDIVRPHPTMPALEHVATRLIGDQRVDMLHPHAPGTVGHDCVELNLLARVATANSSVQPARPSRGLDVYACKGALGHALGAAGLVSFVVACMCARTGKRPPMPWLEQPIESPLTVTAQPTAQNVAQTPSSHAIFAAGFGGHVAGVVIQRV